MDYGLLTDEFESRQANFRSQDKSHGWEQQAPNFTLLCCYVSSLPLAFCLMEYKAVQQRLPKLHPIRDVLPGTFTLLAGFGRSTSCTTLYSYPIPLEISRYSKACCCLQEPLFPQDITQDWQAFRSLCARPDNHTIVKLISACTAHHLQHASTFTNTSQDRH